MWKEKKGVARGCFIFQKAKSQRFFFHSSSQSSTLRGHFRGTSKWFSNDYSVISWIFPSKFLEISEGFGGYFQAISCWFFSISWPCLADLGGISWIYPSDFHCFRGDFRGISWRILSDFVAYSWRFSG